MESKTLRKASAVTMAVVPLLVVSATHAAQVVTDTTSTDFGRLTLSGSETSPVNTAMANGSVSLLTVVLGFTGGLVAIAIANKATGLIKGFISR